MIASTDITKNKKDEEGIAESISFLLALVSMRARPLERLKTVEYTRYPTSIGYRAGVFDLSGTYKSIPIFSRLPCAFTLLELNAVVRRLIGMREEPILRDHSRC